MYNIKTNEKLFLKNYYNYLAASPDYSETLWQLNPDSSGFFI